MRRCLIALIAVAMLASSAMAQDKKTELMLFDFEGKDAAKVRGGQVTKAKARVGQSSLLWAGQTKNTGVSFSGMPVDWSAYNTITFWMYSERANDANFMMIINSENSKSDGMDYYSRKITVNWTGWRFFEYAFAGLGKARSPLGWDQIGGFSFTATGWGNEPKPDTVIYIDAIQLEKASASLRNASFDGGASPEGVPFRWAVEPPAQKGKTSAMVVDDGREGKGLKLVDTSKTDAVGVQQSMGAEVGKTYRLSCWKKGDPVGLYLRWVDSRNQMVKMDAVKMTNRDPKRFEKFEVLAKCPEGAKTVKAWVYSFHGATAEAVVDDVKMSVE